MLTKIREKIHVHLSCMLLYIYSKYFYEINLFLKAAHFWRERMWHVNCAVQVFVGDSDIIKPPRAPALHFTNRAGRHQILLWS